jgi:hypothetical protein
LYLYRWIWTEFQRFRYDRVRVKINGWADFMSANFWPPLDNAIKWASGLGLWKWPLETTVCGENHPSPTENFTSKLNLINLITFSFFYSPKLMDASVDFGCTHPIDALFWSLPIYLIGFLLKIWMLGNWFNHASMSLFFWVVTCLFVSRGFIWLWNVLK